MDNNDSKFYVNILCLFNSKPNFVDCLQCCTALPPELVSIWAERSSVVFSGTSRASAPTTSLILTKLTYKY